MTDRTLLRALIPLSLFVWPATAFAHGGEIEEGQSWWALWQWSPEILIALALAATVYLRGVFRGPHTPVPHIVAFLGGLVALFAALISPIEPLADHIFAVHQVEHMLLRTIGPMLIFLSMPQAVLMRGLPASWRKPVAGGIGGGPVRSLFRVLAAPPVATFLFLLASYFWMVPHWHDLAILDEPIHYMWHVSLLVTGMIFFGVLFDPRRPPLGASLGQRLAMFVVAALGNIVLGAFLTLKTVSLYDAYLQIGHFWHVPMVLDEQTGGAIMWIPGCMMFAISAGVLLYRWGRQETRDHDVRMRDGRAAVARAQGANGRLAMGLAGFAIAMLSLAFIVAITIHHMEESRAMAAPVEAVH